MAKTQYEFQSTLHRNFSEMVDAIAISWITADGMNDAEFVAECLQDFTDAELAAECVEGFGLDAVDDYCDDPDEEPKSHMTFNGYTAEHLAQCFREMRQS